MLIGLPSTGLHPNGYSLARKILFDTAGLTVDSLLPESGSVLGDELLKVHRSYLSAITALLKAKAISAAAHITGGGITDNLPRALPKGLAASIQKDSWQIPPLFEMLRSIGQIPEDDWRRTFNLGVGMILAIPRKKADAAFRTLKKIGEKPWVIGEVMAERRRHPRVEYI
jgi:phosphoribosylformylglycinamidine cyclo-ligase